ncbi:MAG: alpha/beta hydrolase [Chloroflexota bacterium]
MKAGTITTKQGITIAYETLGDPTHETIVFICGLGSQLLYWSDAWCQLFVDQGYHVVRFDNRDVGLSSKTPGEPVDTTAIMAGEGGKAPYTLSDMAADTMGLLDSLGIQSAHIVGTSLGGMIAQTVAIEYPERVRSLTSIMSAPRPLATNQEERDEEAVEKSLTMDMSDPETYVDIQLEGWRVTSGPLFDAESMRDLIQRSFERCYHPAGWAFQMMAVAASGDRTEQLGALSMPTLVIHGKVDPLVPPSAGEATAAAIPGAKLLLVDDMGHYLPGECWEKIVQAIIDLTRQTKQVL